jgi:hypothetical protein
VGVRGGSVSGRVRLAEGRVGVHGRMARGGHVSLKFHPGLPCPTLLRPGQATPETSIQPFQAVFYRFGHPTSYAYVGVSAAHICSTMN